MKVQATDETKSASAPPLVDDQVVVDSMYPNVPQYLASNTSLPQQQQQHVAVTPMYIMPQQQQHVMYSVPTLGNIMLVPNTSSGAIYLTPQQYQQYQQQQQMYYNYQTITPQPPQQQYQYQQPMIQPQMQPQNARPSMSQQQPIQPQMQPQNVQQPTEEEKPYFVHELNRHTDTLMKLALRYHCHEEDIKMLNSLLCDDLDLYEGRTLLIPKCDPSLIKKNYDLEDTREQTQKQRQLMVTTFSKNNKITIDEAKVYLEMNDWNSKKAQEELLADQNWEKQTTGSVKKPSDFKQANTKTYKQPANQGSTLSYRKNDKYPQYGFEMMAYER